MVFASIVSVLIVSLISLIGAATIAVSHKRLENLLLVLVGLSAGAMFGDAFIHLIPEIFAKGKVSPYASLSILGGILLFFAFEKVLRWHHHHHGAEHCTTCGQLGPRVQNRKHLGQLNLISDGLHNFVDGLVIGAAYIVSMPIGIATTIAVALHEIPQEIGDFGLLLHSGYERGRALFLNFGSALVAFLGLGFAFLFRENAESLVNIILPLAAGSFIYIAGSDLVPELHKETRHSHSLAQLAAIIVGIVLMFSLTFVK